ncbi:MAG: NirD/YgiW/YdeI family stress tolerance protein [Cardiobacteriaceae bacterium]|nr:NirD/YgiW/YdeI family stress tolerance protein [Cardiobacteriaceae bacterium]
MNKMKTLGLAIYSLWIFQAWSQFVPSSQPVNVPPPIPQNNQAQHASEQQAQSTQKQLSEMVNQFQALAQSEEMKKLVEQGKALTEQVKTDLKRDTSEVLMDVAKMAQQFSQQVNPDNPLHTQSSHGQSALPIDPHLQGLAYVRQLPHGSLVQMQGYLTAQVANKADRYWFSDGREQVWVEIEAEVFRGQKISPNTLIQIWAEVERQRSNNGFKELEVDYLEIVKP